MCWIFLRCDQIKKVGDCHARRSIGRISVRTSFALVVPNSNRCQRRRAHDAAASIGVVDADVEIIVVVLHPPTAGYDVVNLDAQPGATRIVRVDDTRDRGSAPRLESQVAIPSHGVRRIAHGGTARIDGRVRADAGILVR